MFAGHDPLDFGTVCKVHRFLYTMACDFAAIGFTTSRVDLRRGGGALSGELALGVLGSSPCVPAPGLEALSAEWRLGSDRGEPRRGAAARASGGER